MENNVKTAVPKTAAWLPQRLTQYELDRLRRAIQPLVEKLFKQKFGVDMPEWDQGDTIALERYLRLYDNVREVEQLETRVKNYFQSDGIGPQHPYEWLRKLYLYGSGPLNLMGISKTELAATDEEIKRRNEQIVAAAAQRKAEREAEEAEQRFQLDSFKVTRDLRSRGYEVFSAIQPTSTCHLIATSQTDRRIVSALRIAIGNGKDLPKDAAGVYVATVQEDRIRPVVYTPELGEY
jgi:hypothetical protein